MKAINRMIHAALEEIDAMRSGRFMPYHRLSLMIALITCLVFSIALSHQVVFKGRVAVVDLDSSSWSQHFIELLNTSSYIQVTDVFRNPVDPVALVMGDRNLGVLYIPHDTERNIRSSRRQVNLGYFADYTNEAQNAEVIETLNSISSETGAGERAPRVMAMSGTGAESAGSILSPLRTVVRRLGDPVFSATNNMVIAFIFFFSSIYLGLTVLMIPGRLRVTGQFRRAVLQGPLCMMARLIPYAFFYTTAISVDICLLTTFGQLRFDGNFLLFVPSIFMTGMCIGLFGFTLAWKCAEPGMGAAFMILIVPPGFITGGSTLATGFLNEGAYVASNAFPLVWQYRLWRDFAFRAENFMGILSEYGGYICYASVLGLLVLMRWRKSWLEIRTRSSQHPVPGERKVP